MEESKCFFLTKNICAEKDRKKEKLRRNMKLREHGS
jgi:hypothetical protein